MNVDGLSYLDIARAFGAGDLKTAINPHWGPLYPLLIGRVGPSWKDSLLLGGVLGLGYLAKSVMFPVGACFLVAAALVQRPRGRGLQHEIASAAAFFAVAAVLIVPISRATGRPTFG